MTGQLTGYEETSVVEVGAVLDNSPATAEEVYLRTIGHSERAIAAVAAKRAGSGGGGGGGTVLGPYIVNWDSDPNINSDVFYVPGAASIPEGFWITDTLVEFTEEWGDGGDQPSFSMQATLEVSAVEDIHVAEWINKIDPYNGQSNIVVDALNNDTFLPTLKRQFRLDTAKWSAEQGETITAAKLSMEIYSNRNPFTKGQLRVWALGVQA